MADQILIDMLKKFVEGELQEFTIIDVKHHFNEFKRKGKENEYGTFMAKTCPTCKYALIFHGRTCGNTILSSRDSRLQTKAINADEDLQQELQTIMMEHDAVEVGSAHNTSTPTTAQTKGFGYTPKPRPALNGMRVLNGKISEHLFNTGMQPIPRIQPMSSILHSGRFFKKKGGTRGVLH